jgi:cell division protein FtsB
MPVVRSLLLIPALVGVAAVYATFDGDSGIRAWWSMRNDLEQTHERVVSLRDETARLREEVGALEGDRFAIERAIREDLGYARRGETVVRTPRVGVSTPRIP